MKYSKVITTFLLIAFLSITVSGCVIFAGRPRPTGGVVYIQKAPPEPRFENVPKSPNPRAVWIPGYWNWNGRKYVWVKGHWDKKPKGANWIPGHWEKHAQGWFWVPGHWR